jgi:hypothetical protein
MDGTLLWVCAAAAVALVVALVRLRGRDRSRGSAPYTGGACFGASEIEAYIREHVTELGRETFPDNPDVKWSVHGFTHTPRLVLAEVVPEPDEVGYSRFKFGFVGGGASPPEHVATYCLESGAYTLLCHTPGAGRGLPRRLD